MLLLQKGERTFEEDLCFAFWMMEQEWIQVSDEMIASFGEDVTLFTKYLCVVFLLPYYCDYKIHLERGVCCNITGLIPVMYLSGLVLAWEIGSEWQPEISQITCLLTLYLSACTASWS